MKARRTPRDGAGDSRDSLKNAERSEFTRAGSTRDGRPLAKNVRLI
jgi:hypothetical protein